LSPFGLEPVDGDATAATDTNGSAMGGGANAEVPQTARAAAHYRTLYAEARAQSAGMYGSRVPSVLDRRRLMARPVTFDGVIRIQ
jgi:hypothetical protein